MTTATVRGGRDAVSEFRVAGLTPDAGQVVAAGFGQLDDQAVLVRAATLAALGVEPGGQLRLGYDSHTMAFRAVSSDVPSPGTLVVTDRALTALAPGARVAAVWAAAADRSDAGPVMAGVRKASGQQAGLDIGGSLPESASLTEVLDSLLRVATGLLGVAVLIALIGVGNTLGLSVIERSRESALLRALGLQRGELRLMLAIEAGLLALVGAVVGIAAGALFGLIGTAAVVQETELVSLHFSMSLGQTSTVVAIAVLAGVLASVIPGLRAGRAAPTEALAEV
jgi:putative ABC transport system permease protein